MPVVANASTAVVDRSTSRPVINVLGGSPVASRFQRSGATTIDFAIAAVATPVYMIAINANLIWGSGRRGYGIALALFWLFRDFMGASPGKKLMNFEVVDASGSPASTGQRIVRNIPMAMPCVLWALPWIGTLLGPLIGGSIFCLEVVMLLASGRRIGDMLASTAVIRR